jgi:hypothetical protein
MSQPNGAASEAVAEKRRNVLRELLETETNYVADLKLVQEVREINM